MKYLAPLFALAATPALAHHETGIGIASPMALISGVVVIALAALVALWLKRTA